MAAPSFFTQHVMTKNTRFYQSVFALLLIIVTNNAMAWLMLSEGLEYQAIPVESFHPFARLNVFKIDLARYQLNLGLNDNNDDAKRTSLKQFARDNHSPLVINGGFFTPEIKPLGLRVDKGVRFNALKPISWWAIFYIKHHQAFIVPYKKLPNTKSLEFAIQAGPRLLIDGVIPKLKPGSAKRTALAISKDNALLIITTQNASLSTEELAELLKTKLNCTNALNLDGGSSTQLFAKGQDFELNLPGLSRASDVLFITKRNVD